MQEYSPSDDGQQIIEFSKEQIVESIAVARDVTHVVEEDEWLPEAVRFIDQLAYFIMLVVKCGQSIVLAAQWAWIGLGKCFDVLAYLLESVAQDETNQIEIGHGEHVDARHEEYPNGLHGNPGDKQLERVLVHILVRS